MFQSARIKLTAWYLLIIMLVSVSFSAVIYRTLSVEIERFARFQRFRIERQTKSPDTREQVAPPPGLDTAIITIPDLDLIQEAKQRLLSALLIVNGFIAIVSGMLGYMLAGKTLRPIRDMMDEQNRFITDASHELRTPLTALKSMMEVHLREDRPPVSETKELLRGGLEEVNHLSRLSNELLQLAQYDAPRNMDIPGVPVSVKSALEQTLQKLKPVAVNKHIRFRTKLADGLVAANEYDLMDLFTVLLDNALKYSPAKSTVTVTSAKHRNELRISVKDEGQGIAKKDVPYIFNRFFRSDSARSRQSQDGYGLGLSIAKKIVDRYHGSIRVITVQDSGSEFVVSLPLSNNGGKNRFVRSGTLQEADRIL